MKYCLLLLLCCLPGLLYGQGTGVREPEGMGVQQKNYVSFSPQQRNVSDECRQKNAAYVSHPELGMLFAEAPIPDCYELIGERTEKTKTFIKEGSGGKEIMLQTSSDAMHYIDEDGLWHTIATRLLPMGNNVYAAPHQPTPIAIDRNRTLTELGRVGQRLSFNNQLELVYLQPNGREKSLGVASWKQLTAGDDGVYITDAWQGVDIEMSVSRGAVKTNFIIRHAMPHYAAGKLLVRDHLQMNEGLQLSTPAKEDYVGNLEILNDKGLPAYLISAATAYEQKDVAGTLQMIGYNIAGNVLDIVLPGSFLNRPATSYPVVIDPLVSIATASTIGGSSYSPTKTISCDYLNAATVPANVKVTDVRWSFNYVASGGALLLNGAADYTLGTCRSPGVAGFFWYCNLASAGTCTGTNVSIFTDIGGCIPAPTCASYPLNLNMHFYQNFASTTPCATTYITSASPLTITVFGRTVEASAVSAAGGLTSICLGQSVSLSTMGTFGVPPYTFSWAPGTVTGSPATLTPTVTTPYTVTVTDACGQTAAAAQTITVTPIASNTGTALVCVGGTTPLANATGAGSWASSNVAVATIGSSSGIVTGVSPGTSLISYVTSVGCYATTVVTVIPVPTAITGTPRVCVGATTALSNPMTGGTWSSGTLAIATVGAATGLVSGVAPGTAIITYATSPGCIATVEVTVLPNPAISSASVTNPTACGASDGTITFNGLVPGAVYTVDYVAGASPVTLTVTANISGQIVITGLTAGLYFGFVVTSSDGCSIPYDTSITLVDIGSPPAPLADNNSPVCDGGTINLTAVSAPGVLYNWTGPGGFTSTLQNPVISPASTASAGVYSVTVTLFGCVSSPATTIVVVNALPNISDLQFASPTTCGGSDGKLFLQGLQPGGTYNCGFTHDGIPSFITVTADALGVVTIIGLSSGTYTTIFVASLSCVSNLVGPVTLIDPLVPPPPTLSTNAPICVGGTLQLFGNDDSPGGAYLWQGPNGFSSAEQNPSIPNVPAAAEGVYSVTYTLYNCTSAATVDVLLQPVIKLTDVTATSYVMAFGDSVQLNASGATFYNWTPHNGTIRNHFIHNPFVKPIDSITVYTVHGMNEWDCHDSASITLRVVFDEDVYIPNSFTPNGDGKNDIFRIGKMQYKKLIDFTIYNRWGQEVYHNAYGPYNGWDGVTRGKAQDVGVYFYSIIIETASGKVKYFKGDVTLIR